MSVFLIRALAGIAVAASLAACVPTTTSSTKAAEPAAMAATVPAEGLYLATSDNGFAVPTVPVEKVPDEFERQVVDYPSNEAPGTVIINPAAKHLFLVTGKGKAIRYGIAVGKAGFEWSGEALITNRRPWPTWTPPPEMIARKPELSKWEKGQPGGPTNPLGARALYLTTNGVDYGYRIHGTPDWWSIGKNASSGCIRMINQDVMDLYSRVPDGAKVVVLTRDGQMPKGLTLPPPAPKKSTAPKAAAKPAVASAQITVPKLQTLAAPAFTKPTPAAVVTPAPVAAVVTPAPAAVTPAPAAVTPAPAAAAPAAAAPAAAAPACKVALVNGVCPPSN